MHGNFKNVRVLIRVCTGFRRQVNGRERNPAKPRPSAKSPLPVVDRPGRSASCRPATHRLGVIRGRRRVYPVPNRYFFKLRLPTLVARGKSMTVGHRL